MSNPSDWTFQPYQNEFNQIDTSPTTTTFAAAASSSAASRNINSIPEQGRVAKPIRRRSRASQRNPTTLLNTDTTNFRAMVQHFTGGPAARQQIPAPYMEHVAAAAPPGGFRMQYPNQVQQPTHHMFIMDNNVHGGGGGAPPQVAPGGGNGINYGGFMV